MWKKMATGKISLLSLSWNSLKFNSRETFERSLITNINTREKEKDTLKNLLAKINSPKVYYDCDAYLWSIFWLLLTIVNVTGN